MERYVREYDVPNRDMSNVTLELHLPACTASVLTAIHPVLFTTFTNRGDLKGGRKS